MSFVFLVAILMGGNNGGEATFVLFLSRMYALHHSLYHSLILHVYTTNTSDKFPLYGNETFVHTTLTCLISVQQLIQWVLTFCSK